MAWLGRKAKLLIGLTAALALVAIGLQAGSLEPPGPPGPTFRTLGEIYNLLLDLAAGLGEIQDLVLELAAGEGVANEARLKGCLSMTGKIQGPIKSEDPNDQSDPLCRGLTRVVSASHGLQPGQLGTLTHSPLSLTKHVDGASPKLYQALAAVEPLQVSISWYRSGSSGSPELYLVIDMTDAYVLRVGPGVLATPSAFFHLEEVAFSYTSIKWTWPATGRSFKAFWGS